jgi:hypothetical protein
MSTFKNSRGEQPLVSKSSNLAVKVWSTIVYFIYVNFIEGVLNNAYKVWWWSFLLIVPGNTCNVVQACPNVEDQESLSALRRTTSFFRHHSSIQYLPSNGELAVLVRESVFVRELYIAKSVGIAMWLNSQGEVNKKVEANK